MHVTSRPYNEVRIPDQSQSLALRQKDICLNFGLKMLRWCDRRRIEGGGEDVIRDVFARV